MTTHDNPYVITSSQFIYENPWISLTEHQILLPNNKQGIYGVVHFKNRAVGVIPYEDKHLWLVGQYRFPLKQYSWEIPEGGSPPNEELVDTARRELKEETGIEATSFEKILEMHLSNSVSDEYGVIFLAKGLKQGTCNPEDSEVLKIKKISLSEAYEMVLSGQITDSLSVAGILRVVLLEKEGAI